MIRRKKEGKYGFTGTEGWLGKRAYDLHILLFFLFYYEIYSIGILRKAGIQLLQINTSL